MSRTTTARIGLSRVTAGTGEPVNAGIDMGTNIDKIDAAVGATVCTSSTRPGTPYDGQFIRETDTRRLYVWNATQAAWDHVWLPFPGGRIVPATSTTNVLEQRVSGEGTDRFNLRADGRMDWGPGNAALDTNLFRNAANVLRTNDSLQVDGDLTVLGNLSTAVGNIGIWKSVYKTAFETQTSDTTLSSDSHLTFANIASAVYHFRLVAYVTGSINGDIKYGWTFPTGAGGATITWMGYGVDAAATTQAGNLQSAGFVESTTADQTLVFNVHGNGCLLAAEGYIKFGSTVGALTLRWAQNVSNATGTSIREGSRLDYMRVV